MKTLIREQKRATRRLMAEIDPPELTQTVEQAARQWDLVMQAANAELYAPITDHHPTRQRPDGSADIDRLPLWSPDKDGIHYPSRLRQRAVSHALKWDTDSQDTEARLLCALVTEAHTDPSLLTSAHSYGYILNRITWAITDQDKIDAYRSANLLTYSLDQKTTTGTELGEIAPDDALTVNLDDLPADCKKALDQLDDDERTALILQSVLGYSRTETAEAMERTPNQTRYTTRKALANMRRMLAEYNATDSAPHATDCTCRLCRKRPTDHTNPTCQRLPDLPTRPDPNHYPRTVKTNDLIDDDRRELEMYLEMRAM